MIDSKDVGFRFDTADIELFSNLIHAIRNTLIVEQSKLMHNSDGGDYYPLYLIFAVGHLGKVAENFNYYIKEMSDGKRE